ncbi:MAG: aminomethyl-transferring glycine dehydrogenase subunit GcvPB, partial [Bacillota bacterium]|nr:aminomethyl-transferring glycine dehydrogenase subunit GcvPB [Bacillota bacterium]
VKKILEPFLPVPTVVKDGDRYHLDYDRENSLGRLKDFQGHFAVLVRGYTYILTMGSDGLKEASTVAVLNANYIMASLKDDYKLAYDTVCKHECVFAGLKDGGDVRTLDVAKRLLDMGYHPPTVYFPLIVPEALMIEPTETESKETIDSFIAAMKTIAREAKEDPEKLHSAPHTTLVRRPDETLAARKPILKYSPENE